MSTPNTEKRVPKNTPKLKVDLTEEQKEVSRLFYEYDVMFVHGDFGSGKTLSAIHTALTWFNKRQCNEIWITRPMLKNELAALPGAQPLYSKILTPNGWTTMGDIKEGDSVYAYDGKEVKVLGVFDHGQRDVYEITTLQGRKTRACDKHLWEVQKSNYKRKYNKPELVNTIALKDELINKYGGYRFSLPMNGSVNFLEKDLPLHPYVMGAFLGDGSSGEHTCFCNPEKEIYERFNELIKPIGCELTLSKDLTKNVSHNIRSFSENNKPARSLRLTNLTDNTETVYCRIGEALKSLNIDRGTLNHRCSNNSIIDNIKYEFIEDAVFSTNPFKNILNDLGLIGKKAWDKFIPKDYLLSSYDQRIELLSGMLDTDGNIKKNGEINYTTTSERMKNDLIFLVNSLGGRTYVNTRDRREKEDGEINGRKIQSKRIAYEIGITFANTPDIFYVSRKKDRIQKERRRIHKDFVVSVEHIGVEEVRCIKIDHPSELYITDDFIVTHNTLEEKLAPYVFPLHQNMHVCQGKDTTDKLIKEGVIKIMPVSVAKGCSFMDSVVVVDEYQDMSYADFRTMLTRLSKGSKMIFCGSKEQIDKQIGKNSCIYETMRLEDSGLVGYITLKSNHRNPILTDIINFLEKGN